MQHIEDFYLEIKNVVFYKELKGVFVSFLRNGKFVMCSYLVGCLLSVLHDNLFIIKWCGVT